jgi:hypothetical protein
VNYPEVIYRPRSDATLASELSVLADAYSFLLYLRATKNPATGPSERGENDETTKEASADGPIIQ